MSNESNAATERAAMEANLKDGMMAGTESANSARAALGLNPLPD